MFPNIYKISEKLIQHGGLCSYALMKFRQIKQQQQNKQEEEKELIFNMCQKTDVPAPLILMMGVLMPSLKMVRGLEM